MLCTNCGQKISDDSKFCTFCGGEQPSEVKEDRSSEDVLINTARESQDPKLTPEEIYASVCEDASLSDNAEQTEDIEVNGVTEEDVTETVEASLPVEDPQKKSLEIKTLVWAIFGFAFSASFFLAPLGIVFSAISRAQLKKYLKRYGELTPRTSVGRDLAIAGLVIGIIFTVLALSYLGYQFIAVVIHIVKFMVSLFTGA